MISKDNPHKIKIKLFWPSGTHKYLAIVQPLAELRPKKETKSPVKYPKKPAKNMACMCRAHKNKKQKKVATIFFSHLPGKFKFLINPCDTRINGSRKTYNKTDYILYLNVYDVTENTKEPPSRRRRRRRHLWVIVPTYGTVARSGPGAGAATKQLISSNKPPPCMALSGFRARLGSTSSNRAEPSAAEINYENNLVWLFYFIREPLRFRVQFEVLLHVED